jgi:hypothetical protein
MDLSVKKTKTLGLKRNKSTKLQENLLLRKGIFVKPRSSRVSLQKGVDQTGLTGIDSGPTDQICWI